MGSRAHARGGFGAGGLCSYGTFFSNGHILSLSRECRALAGARALSSVMPGQRSGLLAPWVQFAAICVAAAAVARRRCDCTAEPRGSRALASPAYAEDLRTRRGKKKK